jgi:hypothetical protein
MVNCKVFVDLFRLAVKVLSNHLITKNPTEKIDWVSNTPCSKIHFM